ncbi:hypothetical protein PPTG_18177 [Phytophthora nicotianae INRA-310]|uniref:Uncharacterized protein n=1 Tax=Phytophthora nicotianae (strain INRA-310) TaxID=761204 RepID=W2PIV4_PHYN3|nr:hypothetical protein PPTG_18177 [Phytophthora nicotianae INRA-310]ETN00174.1 hypothetical protein PPTG_18177 [Phytophthora nicotianae INRA-310]
MWWQNDEYMEGFIASHEGHCESYPTKIPVVHSSRKSDCYWLALHEPNWQIYKQCVPITDNGSGASTTTQSPGVRDNGGTTTTQASASTDDGDSDETQSEASVEGEASNSEQTESTEAPSATSNTPAPDTATPEPQASTDAPETTPSVPEATPATPTEAATPSGKCGLRRRS